MLAGPSIAESVSPRLRERPASERKGAEQLEEEIRDETKMSSLICTSVIVSIAGTN